MKVGLSIASLKNQDALESIYYVESRDTFCWRSTQITRDYKSQSCFGHGHDLTVSFCVQIESHNDQACNGSRLAFSKKC